MIYLANAFSLSMLDLARGVARIDAYEIPLHAVRRLLRSGFKSVIGHQQTADVMSEMLGIDLAVNRESITLRDGDILIVAQYKGPRLPEGATTLPEGASIQWIEVTVFYE